ncbi:2OG-Fe(II) oxygenase [Rhizobium ruizarguesonis]|uniref:2OG-Fe(II) oxygenase n=1 Tax=Rhizobium ruizarguesonis TaxID=2081791 RepID=UPI0013C26A65|nr:2OG-Fe(II) oxygenase [Rhizobium ruizarguesonis]NEJ02592.1 hypothetical protein [Rhizobium ruizarguesonis]NEJ39720.1 hypothetical protein [Rhizobium ruizarguesonis]
MNQIVNPIAIDRHSVRVSETLKRADLEALAAAEIIALRVPNYCDYFKRGSLIERITSNSTIEYYKKATGVARIGKALVETKSSSEDNDLYFSSALEQMHQLRQICGNVLNPFDQFRLELDEQWRGGAQIAPFKRGKAFAGLLRIFEEGGFAHPHQDTLQRDAPGEPVAAELLEQFAMNIYLQTSSVGGELELWDIRPSIEEYTALRNSASHGIDKDKLPPSAALIKPQDGDLILFRSTNLHAVHKVEGQRRITWASFIGVRSPQEPLLLWS